MKNMILELFNELQNLTSEVSELNAYDTKFERTPNGFIFSAVKKPEPKKDEKLIAAIDDFKKYIGSIEDFFFDEACDLFNKYSNIGLSEFEELTKEAKEAEIIYAGIELFKNCVKEAVTNHIVELQNRYELNK